MKKEIFEGQECPTWKEMYNMIFSLVSSQNNYDGSKALPKYRKMIAFMQTVRPFFEVEEKKCRIYGSEITFELFVSENELKENVKDIWDFPSKYYAVADKSHEAWYQFWKYLWIDFPNGNTVRLSDYANDNNII